MKVIGAYLALSRLYSRLLGDAAATVGNLNSHPETWIEFDKLGTRSVYKKTFSFQGDFINPQHRFYSECKTGLFGIPFALDIGIDGYLQRGDALKLYEMAYFCQGDILELGTHKGLSTSILLGAVHDAGRQCVIETVDVDPVAVESAKASIGRRPSAQLVHFNVQDAGSFLRSAAAEKRKFGFMFVDHWHGFEATLEAAEFGRELLTDGGFILFHDYNDPSNFDPEHVYGVYQAVAETLLPDERFTFFGNFGCCGLFRKSGQS